MISGLLDNSVVPYDCTLETNRTLFFLGYYHLELGIARPIIFTQESLASKCRLRYFEGMRREYNPYEYDLPFNWVTGWFVQV